MTSSQTPTATEVWQLGDEELLDALIASQIAMNQLYAAQLTLLAEANSRDLSGREGFSKLTEWTRTSLRLTRRESAQRVAHATAAMPSHGAFTAPPELRLTGEAAEAGLIGAEHIEVIRRAITTLPPWVSPQVKALAEADMVHSATGMDARTLIQVGLRIHGYVNQDGSPPTEPELATPRRELHLSHHGGRLRFTGELDAEAGALFEAVLSPLAAPRPASNDVPDPRSPQERRGDALVDILHLAAGAENTPREVGERPHVAVTIPLEVLELRVNAALLDGVGRIGAAQARRLACDAKVIPVVLGSKSEVLDIGRLSRLAHPAARRAITLRDRGCTFPDCDRPSRWCEAHHVTHWADGGATNPDNLVLLCPMHHTVIHHSRWQVEINNGRAEFRPPRYVDRERRLRHNTIHARLEQRGFRLGCGAG